MNTKTAERYAAAAREITVTGNLHAAEVAGDAPFRDVTTTKRQASRVGASLINFLTEVEDFLWKSTLFRFKIQYAVYSRLGTFISTLDEAYREKVMFRHGDNDCKIDCVMAEVQRQLPCLCGSVHTVKTQLPSVTDPARNHIEVLLTHATPPVPRLSIPFLINDSFLDKRKRTSCHFIISSPQ